MLAASGVVAAENAGQAVQATTTRLLLLAGPMAPPTFPLRSPWPRSKWLTRSLLRLGSRSGAMVADGLLWSSLKVPPSQQSPMRR